MSCNLKTSLMCPSDKAPGLKRRAVSTHAVGSGSFRGWLAAAAPETSMPTISPELRESV